MIAGNMPLEMAHPAITVFPKRVRMRIEARGATFRHRKCDADLLESPLLAGKQAPDEEDDADD